MRPERRLSQPRQLLAESVKKGSAEPPGYATSSSALALSAHSRVIWLRRDILTRISRSASGKLYTRCRLARLTWASTPPPSWTDMVQGIWREDGPKLEVSRVEQSRRHTCDNLALHRLVRFGPCMLYVCIYTFQIVNMIYICAFRRRPHLSSCVDAERTSRPSLRSRA